MADIVSVFSYALSCPSDSPEQGQALKVLKQTLEQQPAALPQFAITLLQNSVGSGTRDSLLKRFSIELLCFALSSGSTLSLDVRTQCE